VCWINDLPGIELNDKDSPNDLHELENNTHDVMQKYKTKKQ